MRILVSAGEASGDMYAARLVNFLRQHSPDLDLFGCAGPRLREQGVDPVLQTEDLSVVGLAEVVEHLPRIYGLYRRLLKEVKRRQPVAAILTDSPDFHLRLAKHLKRAGVPVFYLVAPQVWAWRQGRVKIIRRLVNDLFCLFPFEEQWFRERGVNAHYIGHPLARMVRPKMSKADFFRQHDLDRQQKVVVLLPGSRVGEASRHLPTVLDSVAMLQQSIPFQTVLAVPHGFVARNAFGTFRERFQALSIKVIEDQTWDAIAHADLALAASGTVTVETAILGTPMVTYYRVTNLSWRAGRWLVKAPFLTMVNLIAQRNIVPELIQHEMTAERIAEESALLLTDEARASIMRGDLAQVRLALNGPEEPLQKAATLVWEALSAKMGAGRENGRSAEWR